MTWQDLTITGVNIMFSLSLIPQVYDGFRRKKGVITLGTSIPTFLGLITIGYTFFTLHLVFSSAMSLIAASLWWCLLVQRVLYK